MVTKADIISQLTQMRAPTDKIVLMHSSLRAVGPIEGGAQALLDALVDYFTRDGGLFCVPTHTWHNLDKEITLNMSDSDNCLGAFSTVALEDGRGLRSESPTHSMVVFGDRAKAEKLIQDEPLVTTPTAPNSCYGKLDFILLVGVAQNRNTYLHCVDEMLSIPNRMEEKTMPLTIRRTNGEVVTRPTALFYTDYIEDISDRFIKYDTPFRYHRCITDGFIGNAPTQLCNARKMRDTIALIWNNSGGIDPLFSENPIPQKWYCTHDI
ncbi:MAG: AAC(3) family N-acetyltransferase [Oscillospiraceae bacterium]|nr:AAC(3) family N-acetyltransferase [Oscillospiraceae bacterium]